MKVARVLNTIVKNHFQEKVTQIRHLPLGYNSDLFVVATDDNVYLAKFYERHGRQRLQAEFTAFAYLWSHGVRAIPQPLYQDALHNIGIFAYIEGQKLSLQEISISHIQKLIDFLEQLYKLSRAHDARQIGQATDACLRLDRYFAIINRRLTGLKDIRYPSEHTRSLRQFLNEFVIYYDKFRKEVRSLSRLRGISLTKQLPQIAQTFSPSDIGFHNILIRNDQLIFVDFEYFGWDDPAKMVADLFHHPRALVTSKYRSAIVDRVDSFLSHDEKFLRRLSLVYLLCGLNWCLILLNVFRHSGHEAQKEAQLILARQKLAQVLEEWRERVYPLTLQ